MATDIATMKTRIVSEIGGRTDLTSNITDAINDAIEPVPFTSCRILYYTVRTAQGDQPGTYAP